MFNKSLGLMFVVGLVGCAVAADQTEQAEESQAQLATNAPITFAPTADTFVSASAPSHVYGSSSEIWCDSSPNTVALLKFEVAGLNGKVVKSAKLSLHVTNGTPNGPSVYATDTSWSESTVNYNTRPRLIGAPIGDFGALAVGSTVTLDVTSVIKGEGTYSFGLNAQSADAVVFSSKERAGFAPALQLTMAGSVTPPADAGTDASPPPDASTGKVVKLGPSATASQILAAIADNSVDVVELSAGTYSPGRVSVDVDRTRPVVVRPAGGATVIWKGDSSGAGAFLFGLSSRAGRVTLDGLIFDGFNLGDTGVIWVGNAHDLALNHITVRNSTGHAAYSWALYLSTAGGVGPSNIVANDWVVAGAGTRSLSAMTSEHTPNAHGATLHRWNVKNVALAVWAGSDATGLDFADWTIDNAGWAAHANDAVWFQNVKGSFKNVNLTSSGPLQNVSGTMTDLGGNTW